MDPSFDLPDSTDWLDTPLSLLTPLESSLRCQVCKDFFDNPVITSCSHTFCSLCIRRCLSTEGKCPACRSLDQELKLRRNWAVQELVDAFTNARSSVLDLARKARDAEKNVGQEQLDQPASKKRKVDRSEPEDEEYVPDAGSEGRRTRSRSKRIENQANIPTVEVIDDSPDEDYVPDDGLVACPLCNRRMKNEAVFQHLDTCTGNSAPAAPPPPKQASFGSLLLKSPSSRNQSQNKPLERLPMINYSLLKDNVLRKKLKDLGIPNWGIRPLLQRRHTEWMNLWNANCDSKTPKSKIQLLRELDVWERTQGGMAPSSSSIDSSSQVMRKDFDAAGWSSNHGDDFKRLIANARKKSEAAVQTTVPQAQQAPEESEPVPIPQQPVLSPGAAVDIQQPAVLSIDQSGMDGAAFDFQANQNTSNSQEIYTPAE